MYRGLLRYHASKDWTRRNVASLPQAQRVEGRLSRPGEKIAPITACACFSVNDAFERVAGSVEAVRVRGLWAKITCRRGRHPQYL